jgi:phage tail sheath gpL-like
MGSTAVGLERISRIVGYTIAKGNFNETSPNLPQRVAILAEANTANQSGLSTEPLTITSAQQAGAAYGYGSPIHSIARILFPLSGSGIGGIPVVVYPQAAAGGSVARVQTITVTGTATGNGTHYVKVAGRTQIDGSTYSVNIVSGDTPTVIAGKIRDAINNVLQAPCSATASVGVVTITAKWTGLTSQSLELAMDTNSTSVGVTYAVAESTAGSGTPDVAAALALYGSEWNTFTINSYGLVSATMTALETWNGIPDPTNPTGRYSGTIMKPTIAVSGSVADDPSSTTDARLNNCTIAVAPAPLSKGLPYEAAANMVLLAARCAQDSPHKDINGQAYPDMPGPSSTPAMCTYSTRDAYVKKGLSTVDVVSGVYVVQDFVTTYHPSGENPPQFRYVRNLMLDFNIRYGYYLLEQINVMDKAISADSDTVGVTGVIKPKQWKALLNTYADDLGKRALIADVDFMKSSIVVTLGTGNPDRLETTFQYKRTGTARISSTTATAGFNFG